MNNVENPINIVMDNSTCVIYKASTFRRVIDADDEDRPLQNPNNLYHRHIYLSFSGH